jgi:phosphoserine phosphatase RsbU/P
MVSKNVTTINGGDVETESRSPARLETVSHPLERALRSTMSPTRVRVLVCEDDGLISLTLRKALTVVGYEVIGEAKDGEEAVQLANRLQPDVILMDVSMPRLDGIEATKRIMQECPTVIIMVTAYSDEEVVQQASDAGAAGYLVKPVNNEQLQPAITLACTRFAQFAELVLANTQERKVVEEAERRAVEAQRLARELKQQLHQEQAVARALAETFLSQTLQLPGFQVASRYEPASEVVRVGGDYFDFIELGRGRVGMVIGDVCGKGTPAAAFTAKARYMLRAYAVEDPAPARVLSRLNHVLYENMGEECTFLTMVYGVLDLRSASFTYANAGHPPPTLFHAETGAAQELDSTGTLLGVVPGLEFEQDTAYLSPHSVLALFTDGITEARTSNQMFGNEGVWNVIRQYASRDAGEIAEAIFDAASNYAGGHLNDDVALVVIRRS